MGGAVSSGKDNQELVDNLKGGRYIRTPAVERVFRALDRADYMVPITRDQAYKDVAWRYGLLHLSAPCIYSEVMEGLELRPGLSFLNIGSGTGYLSTMVGLIIGPAGINHGVEVHSMVVEYAYEKLRQFSENCSVLDSFEFCEPRFFCGNGLCLAPLQAAYDRVYCGAGCPEEYKSYFKQLIRVNGILVMPLNDHLLQVKRVSETKWMSRVLLNVSFATLKVPATKEETEDIVKLEEQKPPLLQLLCRGVVREHMRRGVLRRHPELREPAPPAQPPPRPPRPRTGRSSRTPRSTHRSRPRSIIIPVEQGNDIGMDDLHDLDERDPASGAVEMSALLRLVLDAGHSRVAGTLRFDASSSSSSSSSSSTSSSSSSSSDEDAEKAGEAPPHPRPRPAHRTPRPTPQVRIKRAARRILREEFEIDIPQSDSETPPRLESTSDNSPASTSSTTSTGKVKSMSTDNEPQKTDSKMSTTQEEEKPSTSTATDNGRGAGYIALDQNVPSEVELFISKDIPSTMLDTMVWEHEQETSEEEDLNGEWGQKEEKRVKLDSGIGDNSPSSGSARVAPRTDDSEPGDVSNRSSSLTDDFDDATAPAVRHRYPRIDWISLASSSVRQRERLTDVSRRLKRRAQPDNTAGEAAEAAEVDDVGEAGDGSDSGDAGNASAGGDADDGAAGDTDSPRPGQRNGTTARIARLSYHMKQAVKELPLPHILKKYVNLGRCYQF